MRRLTVLLALLALIPLTAAAAGCGAKEKVVTTTNSQGAVSTRTVPSVRFAKVKFVLHSALAYGAFHRYIYKPYRAGSFKSGATGRKKALVKAAAAGVFVANELRLARRAALSDDKLRAIGDRLGGLLKKAGALAAGLKAGQLAGGGISSMSGGLDDIVGLAKKAGIDIPLDKTPSVGG